jgi:hypothetical protein
MKIGTHFTLAELTRSQEAVRRGLPNVPDDDALADLRKLVEFILDPLREAVGPVFISSAYRSPRVNTLIGGARTSQHVLGQAADLTVPGMLVPEVVAKIREMGLPFDQLIDEFSDGGSGWVHVSYSDRHRRQVLRASRRADGSTAYEVIP